MKKVSFSTLAETPKIIDKLAEKEHVNTLSISKSEHVNKITQIDFKKLKDRPEESKAEIVMVGIRMTRAERRQLRAMAGQLEIPIQDIVRHGIALYREKQGLR